MATVEATAERSKNRPRFTEKSVAKLVAEADRRKEMSDPGAPGLSLRMGPNGRATWYVLYTVAGAGEDGHRGPQQRFKLGAYPLMPLAEARTKAREELDKADRGIDPRQERQKAIEERRERTFETILERYVELYVKRETKDGRWARKQEELAQKEAEATGEEPREVGRCPAERLLADFVKPKWESRDLDTIGVADVNNLLDEIVLDRGVPIAREVRKHLAGMFSWAAARGLVRVSPLTGLRRKDLRYTGRDRVLSMEELGRIWDAAGDLGYPFGDWYRLLILTGQRRSEIAGLRRDWFDRDSERLFVIPAAEYKTGIEQAVPLSAPAWRLVESLPKWNEGPFLFSTNAGVRPISGFSKARKALDKKMAERAAKKELPPMEHWEVHDIRRSVATNLARIGIPLEHVERVLGHKVGGVAGIYNRHGYLKEKRAALEKWGALWS